ISLISYRKILYTKVCASNRSLQSINIGDSVLIGNQHFVKINSDNLLMMTSTFTCPHGKIVGGQWVECITCDLAHGFFDYDADSCACEDNYSYRPRDVACVACPNLSTYNTTLRTCQCTSNYYLNENLDSCLSCPTNSTSSVGSTQISQCRCAANYYMNTSDYTCQSCPAHSTSAAGATSINACYCDVDYYKSGTTCVACPANSSNADSLASWRSSISSCKCAANYYMDNNVCQSCPSGTTSPAGSTSADACVTGS
ncbi:hypothetical protein IJI99_02705, partial [bacterium]|nr:hypothetical protein [bacterium]